MCILSFITVIALCILLDIMQNAHFSILLITYILQLRVNSLDKSLFRELINNDYSSFLGVFSSENERNLIFSGW